MAGERSLDRGRGAAEPPAGGGRRPGFSARPAAGSDGRRRRPQLCGYFEEALNESLQHVERQWSAPSGIRGWIQAGLVWVANVLPETTFLAALIMLLWRYFVTTSQPFSLFDVFLPVLLTFAVLVMLHLVMNFVLPLRWPKIRGGFPWRTATAAGRATDRGVRPDAGRGRRTARGRASNDRTAAVGGRRHRRSARPPAGWPNRISTIIIYQQIQHAKNRPTGYDLNRLMMTDMNDDLSHNYTALKNELLQQGIASGVTTASSPATQIYWHTDIDHWPGKNVNETVEMGVIAAGEDYFKTLGITMQEGRAFTNKNDTTALIFNETAIKRLRIKDPIGQLISWNEQQFRIVGVAKDALVLSPFAPADPTMFYANPEPEGTLMYRLSPNIKTQEAITKLSAIFNRYNPAFPYDYQFSDAEYAKKFKLELLIGKLAGIFAALAVFVSCLGLFGLAAYMAEQRKKEIGIRKVLGARVYQVWLLLSKDFIVLVLISCVIASPIALYFLKDWLQKYNYRIDIGPGVFIISAVMALVITIVTISFQAIKAAVANPVKGLRTELVN